jgi:iron complex transport system ATP-binding protein
LTATEISAGYPRASEVVRRVSASLRPGEVFCLVGPNGAGKSTLLGVLAGLVIPDQGEVRLGGQRLARLPRRERAKRIGYLPQVVRPSIPYSVHELVALGRHAHGSGWSFETADDSAAIERAMDQTRTRHLEGRLFSQLSGGERQRVLIASVLSGEPEVILLDEPTASLDIGRSCAVFETLAALAAGGRTIGVVTHDLNLAGQFADEIGLIASGDLIALGAPRDVLKEETLRAAYGEGFVLVPRSETDVPAVLPAKRRGDS